MFPSCSEDYKKYFIEFESKLEEIFRLINEAKAKGFDPKQSIHEEIRISRDFADRIECMVGPPGVGRRIRELSHMQRVPLAFKIVEEILYGEFGNFEVEKAAEQAIKTGTAILTEGVTAAPIQGIVKVSIKQKQTDYGVSRYLSIYFAGPIRSAGGTELALIVVLGDYVRKLLGLDVYRASDEEVSRFIEELRLYEREVSRFQFHVDDETLAYILQHLPVEVTGIKTDPIEVSSFRDIPTIETNAVRGGALRVVNDGIAGRAGKVWKVIDELNLKGWDWLKNIVVTREEESEADYLQDIIAGRPVFSFPSTEKFSGRFRLRYGRARNTGLACVGVHPATMIILDGFLAVGTQLRLEMPGKGGIVGAVETIEPPIVKLKDGSVVRVENVDEANKIKDKVEKILFLGDLLISFSEFYENEKPLAPPSYVEEWWVWDLKKALKEKFGNSIQEASKFLGIQPKRLEEILNNFLVVKPDVVEALKISLNLKVPLHPRYTYFWKNIGWEEFVKLRNTVLKSKVEVGNEGFIKKLFLDFNPEIKLILEKLLIPHRLIDEKIVVEDDAASLTVCLGYGRNLDDETILQDENPLKIIRRLTGFWVKDKFACFIGARMGRPEKAKERKMKPPVHVLFPVGLAGGSQRNLVEASKKIVEVEIVKRKCPSCGRPTFKPVCPICGVKTVIQGFCPFCGRVLAENEDVCPQCKVEAKFYSKQIIDLKEYLNEACERLGLGFPDLVKGVKGLTNKKKIPEPLEKGLLRAKYGLSVFKDGTIRYDLTNAPLTHFKPSEIGVTIQKLKELGYEKDYLGNPLTNPDQLCELKVQDIIVPEKCGDFLVKVACFIDDLLEKLYGLKKFYNVKDRNDLIGHLVVGLSPHTSNGVLGRIIGFSKLNVCYSHPLWISAKRRDCDGDEDSIILALDAFLNFSTEYLPAQIGGIMDTPLLLTPIINPFEVDDQAWSLDLCKTYPPEFYEKAEENVSPRTVLGLMDVVMFRLGKPDQYENYRFMHDVSNLNVGVRENTYKKLETMMSKLQSQMFLMNKIEGVNVKDVAKRVLNVHFMRDIVGNLKGFATQSFRCKKCNQKFRRIPLKGRCLKCGGELSLTVYKGTVEKYLEAVEWIANLYGIEDYYKQRIELVQDEIKMVFAEITKDEEKKKTLTEFM